MRRMEGWNSIVFVSIIIVSAFIAGCLGSSEKTPDTDPDVVVQHDSFQMEGQVETLAQASPNTVTEEIHFEIPDDRITRIRINVSIEDGDQDTDVDHIDQIRMWRETGGEPQNIETAPGGDTPYTASIEFEYKGDENLVDWWIVEITATCAAGEDTWIGPFIWSGVPDHGVFFEIEADYDHLSEEYSDEY